ncbi:phosphatidylinositol mannoside acyltransferase [Ornithinimicrobium sp. F0845]|uniref:phosphatidylinositol mannoside acyltransferase n=1 Tax=Ornithinimicrobium sp. F0845 TaxID=2926412 RepID=UPI001FF1444E|nr:phosphatidylinositol mannoside acyltransferase [Ornithinimicrobium sp. F0845]MCK0111933.1 phosphatidylinositol mannoside acyltransferase [Ornithinimicrobium sp. F0845]
MADTQLAFSENISLLAYRLGWRATRTLPAAAAYRLFDRVADGMHRRGGHGVDRLRANYARIRPELSADELEDLVRVGLRSYLRYWCDSFRLPDRTAEELSATVRVVGDGAPRAELEGGRGVVCFLGHLGNWDTVGAWATHHLAPVTTVAERLKPEQLFNRFLAYRQSLGMTILPLTGGQPPFPTLVRTVHEGGLVPLLADRDLTDSGVEVTLCGHAARMAGGPAALALATGAPLHPVTVTYEPGPTSEPDRSTRPDPAAYRVVLTFAPAVTVPEAGTRAERIQAMTQACADVLGETLRTHTEDWHMMQKVFVADGIR